MCSTCQTTQGPFITIAPNVKVCGPIQYEKETGRIRGRVLECNNRRRALENLWYGKPDILQEPIVTKQE
jgi:hypothetical protein